MSKSKKPPVLKIAPKTHYQVFYLPIGLRKWEQCPYNMTGFTSLASAEKAAYTCSGDAPHKVVMVTETFIAIEKRAKRAKNV